MKDTQLKTMKKTVLVMDYAIQKFGFIRMCGRESMAPFNPLFNYSGGGGEKKWDY